MSCPLSSYAVLCCYILLSSSSSPLILIFVLLSCLAPLFLLLFLLLLLSFFILYLFPPLLPLLPPLFLSSLQAAKSDATTAFKDFTLLSPDFLMVLAIEFLRLMESPLPISLLSSGKVEEAGASSGSVADPQVTTLSFLFFLACFS